MSKAIKLNLGSGVHLLGGWINVDNYFTLEEAKSKEGAFANAIVDRGAKFVKADLCQLPFPDNYADLIECHQVLEHLMFRKVPQALKEIYRVLKPKGVFRCTVPSMDGLALAWLDMSTYPGFDINRFHDGLEIIYGNQYAFSEGEVHRGGFTTQYLNNLLLEAGFKDGFLGLAKKGSPVTKFGLVKAETKKVYRFDNILCEMKK